MNMAILLFRNLKILGSLYTAVIMKLS